MNIGLNRGGDFINLSLFKSGAKNSLLFNKGFFLSNGYIGIYSGGRFNIILYAVIEDCNKSKIQNLPSSTKYVCEMF